MQEPGFSIFQGLSAEDLSTVLERLEHRSFAAGSIVLTRGETPSEIFVIQSGVADIFLSVDDGQEHRINRVGPGASLGEMALFTGQPASATVRATTTLDVLVLSEADFHYTATTFPVIYRNIGTMLSERLVHTNRRALSSTLGRVGLLLDSGSQHLLGYALACSVAWHAGRPTLHLVISDHAPSEEIERLSKVARDLSPPGQASVGGAARAHLRLERPSGAFAHEALAGTIDDLRVRFDYILVQVASDSPPALDVSCGLRLTGACGPQTAAADRFPTLLAFAGSESDRSWRPDRHGIIRVPALGSHDEQALREGLLPATTPAGRALSWAARHLAGLKVGLALGAGSAKGYAHLGVLQVLLRAGLPVDCIAGTSVGAVVATLHALGHNTDQAASMMDRIGSLAFRPALPINSLLSTTKLCEGIRQVAGTRRIEDLHLPLGLVAADMLTGQEVVFRRGLIWPAVMASIALPGIFPPQRMGPYTLVDGGVVNPVPVNVAAAMGADLVIAVKLANRSIPPAVQVEARATSRGAGSVVQTILRAIDVLQSKITTETAAAATFVIEPVLEDRNPVGLRNFSQGRRYIALGEAAAEAALPRITAALPWLCR